VDTQAATAWQRGKLVFQNRPLGEVLAELNRYHHGYFTINDSAITQRRVNGVFRTDQPLAVIDALQNSLKLHSTRLGGYWVILHQ
jgi:transmembrane sensor